MAVRLTSASIAERKQGSRPVSLIDRDSEMRTERQVHPNHQQLRLIGSIAKAGEGEQVAAGWPAWLVAVAGEAIRGWVPRRADSFEKLDKVSFKSSLVREKEETLAVILRISDFQLLRFPLWNA